ncbi:MAG: Mur ligase family protein [Pseudomonadota bacterium]
MQLDESRRLTGPNLFSRLPGAICDIDVAGDNQTALVGAWRLRVRELLDAVGWADSEIFDRCHTTGVSLVISAPIDCLYAATDINEAAFEFARCDVSGDTPPDLSRTAERMQALINEEHNAALVVLEQAAAERGTPFLVDDDEVSLGYGRYATSWSSQQVPSIREVDWQKAGTHGAVPVALVTGTNGKSTTVRLAAAIVAAAGRVAGITSTDYIRVGDDVVDTGDYSGPGGARQLLRHPHTDVALLEVARGGMLRRGLGVTHADVALITNVAADHLGEYGIHTVDELRAAKFVVQRGLAPGKPLILNADDDGVVGYARELDGQPFLWFSETAEHSVVVAHVARGGRAVVVKDAQICMYGGTGFEPIVSISDIPVTLNGNARHNVQNALAAAALGHALGCDSRSISEGLTSFNGGPKDNPGRGNLFSGNGVSAVVDFAHNEHGLQAMAKTIATMPGQRRLVLLGQAGDRSDELVVGLTHAALQANPDQLVVCKLPGYERGREPDEIPKLIERTAVVAGVAPSAIHHADSPLDGTRFALQWANQGDVLLILALTQRDACIELIQDTLQASPTDPD